MIMSPSITLLSIPHSLAGPGQSAHPQRWKDEHSNRYLGNPIKDIRHVNLVSCLYCKSILITTLRSELY
ncbi:MAG TPA: hypothetical protein DEF79_05660 [Gammaproteobacteria bacterium]|nr:hypothetical protein [Gammaproteobacteria bacterium]